VSQVILREWEDCLQGLCAALETLTGGSNSASTMSECTDVDDIEEDPEKVAVEE